MNVIAKRLRKKIAASYYVEERQKYYIVSEAGDKADGTIENEKKIEKYFNSLSEEEKEEFLDYLGIDYFDEEDALQAIDEEQLTSTANEIGLELVTGYWLDCYDSAPNCACMYVDAQEAYDLADELNGESSEDEEDEDYDEDEDDED